MAYFLILKDTYENNKLVTDNDVVECVETDNLIKFIADYNELHNQIAFNFKIKPISKQTFAGWVQLLTKNFKPLRFKNHVYFSGKILSFTNACKNKTA
jgi:hypothetical protein